MISEDFKCSEVTVKTYHTEFGRELVDYLNGFSINRQAIQLKTETGYEFIQSKDILFVEVFQKEVIVHLAQTQISIKEALKRMAEKLDPENFVQISKSTIVNIKKIKRIEMAFSGNYYCLLSNEEKVVISRRYFSDFKKKMKIKRRH
jgi:DNA-binding LytR/AlgR family response regulator